MTACGEKKGRKRPVTMGLASKARIRQPTKLVWVAARERASERVCVCREDVPSYYREALEVKSKQSEVKPSQVKFRRFGVAGEEA
jgi:hypothetical protein